ncbi:hypothetical protein DH09_12200 [Bacillaceae bacterium JMAK1]|nr:hypothetical protein DH09_12200 [Bacillaceae bacterium JMAK1]
MLGISLVFVILIGIGLLWSYNQQHFKAIEKRNPPKGQFVGVDGLELHYISEGDGEPLVLLHGGVISSVDFQEVLPLLAQNGYRCIAFDRPGYGHSDRAKGRTTLNHQAKIIHEAIKQLGIHTPVTLVGHSWSGALVLSYAQQFPNDVKGIVTLGAAMYKEGYPAENGDLLSKIVTTRKIGSLIMNTLLATPLAKKMGKVTVVETFKPEHASVGYEQTLLDLWGRPKQFKANREDVLLFPECALHNSKSYSEIHTPILAVVGELDPFNTLAMAERLVEETPNSELSILKGVGHMIPQNHPEKVVNAVQQVNSEENQADHA